MILKGNDTTTIGFGCGRHCAGLSIFAKKAKTAHYLSRAVVSDYTASRRIYRSGCYFT